MEIDIMLFLLMIFLLYLGLFYASLLHSFSNLSKLTFYD